MGLPISIKIRIADWKKYVERSDVKKPSWFRLDWQVITSSAFFRFDAVEFKAWIYILSEATSQPTDEPVLDYAHAERVCQIPRASLDSAIEKLSEIGLITVLGPQTVRARPVLVTGSGRERDEHGTDAAATERNGTERDGTERDGTKSGEPAGAASPPEPSVHESFRTRKGLADVLEERRVKLEAQAAWLAAYPEPDWVAQQILQAVAWEKSNPRNRKKDFTRFVGNWLGRGWDKRNRAVPWHPPSSGLVTGSGQASQGARSPHEPAARAAAARVIEAIPHCGRDFGAKARARMGEFAWRIVERQGGWAKVHEMIDDGANLSTLQAQWRELAVVMIETDESLENDAPLGTPASGAFQ